jgi:hypothetical protein
MFFIIIDAVHVSGGFSAHHQELIKLYVQPWVLSCFPAIYRWCGWSSTPTTPLFPVFLQLCFPAVPHEVNAVSTAG